MVLRFFLEVLATWWSVILHQDDSMILAQVWFSRIHFLWTVHLLWVIRHCIFYFFFSSAVFSLATLLNNSLQVSITVKPFYQTHFVPIKWTLFLHCFLLATDYSLHRIWQWMVLQLVVLTFQTFSQYEPLPTYKLKH